MTTSDRELPQPARLRHPESRDGRLGTLIEGGELFEAIAFGLLITDEEGHILFANREAGRILTLDVAQLRGERPLEAGWTLVDEAGQSLEGLDPLARFRGGEGGTGNVILGWTDRKAPGIRWLLVTGRPLDSGTTEDGPLTVISFADITERRVGERRLYAQHAVSRILDEARDLLDAAPRLLQTIAESLGWVVGEWWSPAPDLPVLECRASWQIPSLPAGEHINRTGRMTFEAGEGLPGMVYESGEPLWITDVVQDDRFVRLDRAHASRLHGAFAFPIISGRDARGVLVFFSDRIEPPDRPLLQVVGAIGHQIGQFLERKAAEASVRESEARKSAILEAAQHAIITVDHEGRITEFNSAAEAMFGRSRREVVGQEMGEMIVPPSLRERHRAGMARYLATGVSRILGTRLEMPAMRADGSEFPIELTITRVEHPGMALFTGHARDITEQRQVEAERALLFAEVEAQRQRLDAIVANVPGVVWEAWGQPDKSDQRIEFVSDHVTEMLGYTREEWLGTPNFWLTIVHPDDREEAARQSAEIFASGGSGAVQFRWITRDGRILHIYAISSVVKDEQGRSQGMRGVSMDITPRIRTEQQQRFMAEASTVLGSSLHYDETLARVAELAVPTLGDWCTVDILDADGTLRLLAVAHVDPVKADLARELRHDYPPRQDAPMGLYHVMESREPLFLPEIEPGLIAASAVDENHRRILEALNLGSAISVPLVARDRVLGVISLVTDQGSRRYDEEDLRLAMGLAQRAATAIDNALLYREAQVAIESRDLFLSIASHELRSPLTALYGYVSLLQRRARKEGRSEADRRAINFIAEQARRLNTRIDLLLDLSRIESGHFDLSRQEVDLTALLQRIARESRETLAPPHTLRVSLPDAPLIVWGDAVRLEQVVQNLLSNAMKYSPDGGQIHLRAQAEEEKAVIRVSDQGIGIAESALPHLFDRFYRSEGVRARQISGAGLGLYVVKEIVARHDGTIHVESKVDQGSTFVVVLPLARGAALKDGA